MRDRTSHSAAPAHSSARSSSLTSDVPWRRARAPSPLQALSSRLGNQRMVQLAQQLQAGDQQLSQRGDPEEQQADALADQLVAQTPASASHVAPPPGDDGAPLPEGLRQSWEQQTGRDLSAVRVHAGEEAGELAQAIGAKAATAGEHIYFGAGRYQPQTGAGQRLLAHEVAHSALHAEAPVVHRKELAGEQDAGTPDGESADNEFAPTLDSSHLLSLSNEELVKALVQQVMLASYERVVAALDELNGTDSERFARIKAVLVQKLSKDGTLDGLREVVDAAKLLDRLGQRPSRVASRPAADRNSSEQRSLTAASADLGAPAETPRSREETPDAGSPVAGSPPSSEGWSKSSEERLVNDEVAGMVLEQPPAKNPEDPNGSIARFRKTAVAIANARLDQNLALLDQQQALGDSPQHGSAHWQRLRQVALLDQSIVTAEGKLSGQLQLLATPNLLTQASHPNNTVELSGAPSLQEDGAFESPTASSISRPLEASVKGAPSQAVHEQKSNDAVRAKLAVQIQECEAIRAQLRQTFPSLAAIHSSEVTAQTGNVELSAQYTQGAQRVRVAIEKARGLINDGSIPVTALGPVLTETKRELNVTPDSLANGDQFSWEVVSWLRQQTESEVEVELATVTGMVALSLATYLTVGATSVLLGIVATGAGAAAGVSGLLKASQLETAAEAGSVGQPLMDESVEQAEFDRTVALVNMFLASLSFGLALRGAAGLTSATAPELDAAGALPAGKIVVDEKPTAVPHVARADQGWWGSEFVQDAAATGHETSEHYEAVYLLDSAGEDIAEIDEYASTERVFIEDKDLTGWGKLNPKTGTPYDPTPVATKAAGIREQIKGVIDGLPQSVGFRYNGDAPVRPFPGKQDMLRVREYWLRVRTTDPTVLRELERMLRSLKTEYHDWSFSLICPSGTVDIP